MADSDDHVSPDIRPDQACAILARAALAALADIAGEDATARFIYLSVFLQQLCAGVKDQAKLRAVLETLADIAAETTTTEDA